MKKNIKIISVLFLTFLALLTFQPPFSNSNTNSENLTVPISSQIHSRILIIGNSQLDTFCLGSGSGTESDPYIIEDLEIDANYEGACIGIYNTTKYLVIRNCTLMKTMNNRDQAGIFLGNCSNVLIENSEFWDTSADIYFYHSSLNTIQECSNLTGILILQSDENIIKENIWKEYGGISLQYSDNNNISHNEFYDCISTGINTLDSDRNLIEFNLFSNCGNENRAPIYLDKDSNDNIINCNLFVESERDIQDEGENNKINNLCSNTLEHLFFQNLPWIIGIGIVIGLTLGSYGIMKYKKKKVRFNY